MVMHRTPKCIKSLLQEAYSFSGNSKYMAQDNSKNHNSEKIVSGVLN